MLQAGDRIVIFDRNLLAERIANCYAMDPVFWNSVWTPYFGIPNELSLSQIALSRVRPSNSTPPPSPRPRPRPRRPAGLLLPPAHPAHILRSHPPAPSASPDPTLSHVPPCSIHT